MEQPKISNEDKTEKIYFDLPMPIEEWLYLINVYKMLHGANNIIDTNRELGYIEVKLNK